MRALLIVMVTLSGCQTGQKDEVTESIARSVAISSTTISADDNLLKIFREERESIEALIQMMSEDDLAGVDSSRSYPENSGEGLDDERLAAYRSLLAATGFGSVTRQREFDIVDQPIDSFWFRAGSQPVSPFASYTKGIARCEYTPGRVLPSLDDRIAMQSIRTLACRRISGKWFLFYAYDDFEEAI